MINDLLDSIIAHALFQRISLGLGLICFFLSVALVFWLFRDARRRGTIAILWTLLGTVALTLGVFMGFSRSSIGFIAVGGASLALVLLVLLVYVFVRPSEFAADVEERDLSQRLLEAELELHACPSCDSGIEIDFQICPNCNVTLRSPCDYCGRPIKTDWTTCPYCLARKSQKQTRSTAAASKKRGAERPKAATTKRPAPRANTADDLELDFPTTQSGGTKRSSGGSRTSTGSNAVKNTPATFKD
ncbi:MAG: zinc ribbon domain-containing protein [Coriobacteriia bacterium]|nr:zinc ribbon domain-containing protein [Coriobacteriia bacterium]